MSSRPAQSKIFIIDDDDLFADCIAKNIERQLKNIDCQKFKNAIEAINSLTDPLPALIFLDVLLPGVDGFTFLNELVSYTDTAKIPIVLVTSLDLPKFDLKNYGVVAILNKETMTPESIVSYAKRYTH